MVIAVTGHRPPKLGGFGPDVFKRLVSLAGYELTPYAPGNAEGDRVITGMALGWDQAVAIACIKLSIPFTAAVPCQGQENMWPESSRQLYWKILGHELCKMELVTAAPYSPRLMQVRNEWMVDRADKILALWDGSSGGTGNCVKYARAKGKPIDVCWDRWLVTVG